LRSTHDPLAEARREAYRGTRDPGYILKAIGDPDTEEIEPPSRAFAAVSSHFDIAEKPNFSLPAFFGKIDEDFHLGRIKSDKNTAFLLHGWSPIGGSAPASRHNPHPAHNVDD
jgi:hypothetical protein